MTKLKKVRGSSARAAGGSIPNSGRGGIRASSVDVESNNNRTHTTANHKRISTQRILREHSKILNHLRYCKHEICDYILKNADASLIQCFHRIALNILHKKLNVPKNRLKKLLTFKKQLITIAAKSKSLKEKRRALQTGGFAGTLISIVASLLPSLISLITSKKKKKKIQ